MDKRTQVEAERRRYYRLSPEADVSCTIEGMEVVHVVGLGATGAGMRLITNRELPGDRDFPVGLSTGPDHSLCLRARAVWRGVWDFEFCSRHVAGIEFLDLGDSERASLMALLPPPEERSEVTDRPA